MSAVQSFFATWGPWLTLSLIPTIITGLSVMPSTQPVASFLQKVLDILKQILAYLSLVTFKDQDGTFQLPLIGGYRTHQEVKMLRLSYVAAMKMAEANKIGLPLPPPGPLVCLALALALGISGCCAWSGTCKTDDTAGQIATHAIDCGKAAIQSQIAHLLPIVAAILTGGSPNWQDELDSLKAGGVDALACALANAAQEFQQLADNPPSGLTGGQLTMKLAAGKVRANEYAKIKGYVTTNVGKN